ncbi:protein of unknown function [Parasphingorhabdus marina DSM 22363]|uniref:DUF4349 domain-containing protein n=1 Tax=Parasphingorhabdus marina DSM 22363 TaxID=1123272 RepID=A0A1N6CM36_9SPHN|nr:DUF4349 domain-containing protein [Parasphingorhabdus marina]SIN59610.1 protein of unknown function [Parasphingorhabdus marina DSM 22363]
MRKLILVASAAALTLTACSQEISDDVGTAEELAPDPGSLEEEASRLAMPPLPDSSSKPGSEAPAADGPQGRATMPDFTYVHAYRFEGSGKDIGKMQDAHVAACDDMGPQQCRLANFHQNLDGLAGVEASLEFYVATDRIRDLARQMTDIARELGGERVEANINGTNATRQLDQAQLRMQELLAQKARLQAIIDDRRTTSADRQSARGQLATLTTSLNASQRDLDNVASELGFTRLDASYSSISGFGPFLPYALVILLIVGIAGSYYRSRRSRPTEPITA